MIFHIYYTTLIAKSKGKLKTSAVFKNSIEIF